MTATPPRARDVLTQQEAQSRARRVSHISYEIDLELTRGAKGYRGTTTVRFQRSGAAATFLDFRGKRIERLEVNGEPLEPDWNGCRLTLPTAALAAHNTVRVAYENDYDHGGDGFHQFVDPEDGEEYLYTNFEPYEAHRLFPCFDQPDIKATYTLAVNAPAQWELVSNSTTSTAEKLRDGRIRHVFTSTPPFSTYLFALIAGPYHVFRDRLDDLPLGFYCRKSLVKHVDIDELWEITKQGMEFYSDFFDYAYPFDKYDQIFVPEFNAGAMENVGAVTHSERMVFRDPPTENQRSSRAMVILHEMAHMWFGNLVTMRWWNDLWLNESFAEYMAHLALDESTRFTTAWQAFNARKAWAYRQDQLVTTHPIAGQVADTDQTLLNFDGITYAKGAATIQQLVAVLGMDGFRDAMRGYFRRHAFGNTTLHEFLDALQTGAGDTGGAVGDLHQWARVWLETPSLNTLAASWEVDGDRLSRLAIAQTAPPEYPTLRPHQIEVALVRERGGRLEVEALPVHVEGAETEVPAAIGRPAPRLVVPNHNDHAFVKIALDPASLAFVRGNLQRIEDPLLRQLIWQALWNMVRDQQLRSTDYLDLAAAKIEGERDQELVETILGNVQAAIGRYLPDALRQERAHAVSEVAWRALQTAPTGDLQIIWARALIGLAISPPDIERVARLVDGELAVAGLAIDQEMRWAVAVLYVGYGLPGAQQRLAAERARDPSDRGQRALLRAEASVPDAAVKARAWERFLGEGYGSLHLTAAAMGGFHWWVQRELVAPYVERFFEAAPLVFEQKEKEFAQSFFGALFPSGRVEQAVLDRSERLLAEIGDGWPLLRRSLREANDDLARAIKCRAFAASGG